MIFFGAIMAGLVVLLLIPAGINLVFKPREGKTKSAKKKKPTIKLKD